MKDISIECPNTEILGIFKEEVHLLTYEYIDTELTTVDCILIVPVKEYLEQWKIWLEGKKEYCERFEHYCGQMGHVYALDPSLKGTQFIHKWNSETKKEEEIKVNVYTATLFSLPDFEHG